jgi:hypothetical protein
MKQDRVQQERLKQDRVQRERIKQERAQQEWTKQWPKQTGVAGRKRPLYCPAQQPEEPCSWT